MVIVCAAFPAGRGPPFRRGCHVGWHGAADAHSGPSYKSCYVYISLGWQLSEEAAGDAVHAVLLLWGRLGRRQLARCHRLVIAVGHGVMSPMPAGRLWSEAVGLHTCTPMPQLSRCLCERAWHPSASCHLVEAQQWEPLRRWLRRRWRQQQPGRPGKHPHLGRLLPVPCSAAAFEPEASSRGQIQAACSRPSAAALSWPCCPAPPE